jgi:hypothetical protein
MGFNQLPLKVFDEEALTGEGKGVKQQAVCVCNY